MSEILSQAEIEALLSSLAGGDDPASSAPMPSPGPAAAGASPKGSPGGTGVFAPSNRPGARPAVAYEVYDFRRPDKFSKEQLRTLQMLHETFGRLAATSLSGYLRTQVSIELISLEQVPYEEYLRSINRSVFTIVAIPPLSGQAVLEVEFSLVFTMLDKLLGGPGRTLDRNLLTEIEQPLIRQVIERMFTSLKSSWEGIVVVNPSVEGMETSAQFVQIAPPTDIVVSILFEVRCGETRGAMSLCVPYMVLKPITTKLSAQKWFASGGRKQSPNHRRALTGQLNSTPVECAVRLGDARVSIREFLNMRSGDVLRLDQCAEHDLRFHVAKKPKFEGRPAMNGRRIQFTITNALS